jgi:anti-sigma factor RsiW
MDLTPHVEALQRQLVNAAAAGGSDAQELAERLAAALDAAARLAMLQALSDAAAEITHELAPGSVDARLRGRDVEFVVTTPPTAPVVSTPAPDEGDDGSTSRTTLRLPDALKARAETAAAAAGISLNAWFVRAVSAALEPQRPQAHGSSYTGWVR